jgi:hypothetical protein
MTPGGTGVTPVVLGVLPKTSRENFPGTGFQSSAL